MIVFHSNFVPDSPGEWPPYFDPIHYPQEYDLVCSMMKLVEQYGYAGVVMCNVLEPMLKG